MHEAEAIWGILITMLSYAWPSLLGGAFFGGVVGVGLMTFVHKKGWLKRPSGEGQIRWWHWFAKLHWVWVPLVLIGTGAGLGAVRAGHHYVNDQINEKLIVPYVGSNFPTIREYLTDAVTTRTSSISVATSSVATSSVAMATVATTSVATASSTTSSVARTMRAGDGPSLVQAILQPLYYAPKSDGWFEQKKARIINWFTLNFGKWVLTAGVAAVIGYAAGRAGDSIGLDKETIEHAIDLIQRMDVSNVDATFMEIFADALADKTADLANILYGQVLTTALLFLLPSIAEFAIWLFFMYRKQD